MVGVAVAGGVLGETLVGVAGGSVGSGVGLGGGVQVEVGITNWVSTGGPVTASVQPAARAS